MATNLVPVEWRLHAARQFIKSVSEDSWYAWFGDHVTTGAPADVYDMVLDTTVQAYRGMVLAKRIGASDTSLMIRRIPWVSGTVYAMYDHGDPLMFQKDFYVVVDAGSYHHVFKCLDNNNGAASTVEPTFADIDANDEVYQTSDGYRWKYMFSVDEVVVDRFATSSYFPVVANTSVEDAAVSGAIDVIRVYEAGEGYDNYLTGTFDAAHVRVGGNSVIYSLASNTTASSVTGFYTGCMLYISAGNGVGGYRRVQDYYSNSVGKFVVLESAFDVAPTNSSEFELYPSVAISAGGEQTQNAHARALINAIGNAVYRVEMLDRGVGYSYATAAVEANAVVGVEVVANVVPVYSPPSGHGSDAASELGASRAAVSVKLANSESNTIPTTNGFRKAGLLHDPVFANVKFTTTSSIGSFYAGEKVVAVTHITMVEDATVAMTSNVISSNSGLWNERLAVGDQLFLATNTNHQLVTVSAVTNATHIQVNSAASFSCTTTTVELADVSNTEADVIEQIDSNTLLVSTKSGDWGANSHLIGRSSGAYATLTSMERNGVTKGFGTFVQCWKYRGSYVSGAFTLDEFVYQGNNLAEATATAQLHSAVTEDGLVTVLTSNQVGSFDVGEQIKGANSGAVFTIVTKYSPEVKYGSGRVAYVENFDPVERSPTQTESFRLILEF